MSTPLSKLLKESIKQVKANKPKEPVWKGPEEDGITYSLLCRFLCCRERFRLLVVEGLRPADEFNHKIEYGQMWHVCEEELARPGTFKGHKYGAPTWQEELKKYCLELCKRYPLQQEQIDHWYNVCKTQFPLYVDYWSKHKDVLDRTPLLQEQVFCVPYKLPSGRVVKLRGKWDAVDLIGKGKGARVYLMENKTKGDIREEQLKRQLTFDLQTQLYLVALTSWDWGGTKYGPPAVNGKHPLPTILPPVKGVRYNVIRRPLSGGAGTIRQHKPSKSNPQGESKEEFYNRVAQYIKDEPETYFMRWKVEISPEDIAKFRQECLDPILEQLCDWWSWCRLGDPYRPKNNGSILHWRHPFGVYNVLDEVGASDLDEYLMTGSTIGLQRVDKLFTELT